MGKPSKDKRDIYYRKAKEQGWRARSAFKLMQIDENFHILKDVKKVVDLCAAPGSWSQVLSRKLYLGDKICSYNFNTSIEGSDLWSLLDDGNAESKAKIEDAITKFIGFDAAVACNAISRKTPNGRDRVPPPKEFDNEGVIIVAVDLQPMAPIPGVIQLRGDITHYSTVTEIMNHFKGEKADLVVCDGAPDVTGLHSLDIYIQRQLILGALHIACNVLKKGGNFVAKFFRGEGSQIISAQMYKLFKDVAIFKPSSSRNSSIEAFIICFNYNPPKDFDPTQLTPYLNIDYRDYSSLTGTNRKIIPFLVSCDLNEYDSDATYRLQLPGEKEYKYKEPVQRASQRLQSVRTFRLKEREIQIEQGNTVHRILSSYNPPADVTSDSYLYGDGFLDVGLSNESCDSFLDEDADDECPGTASGNKSLYECIDLNQSGYISLKKSCSELLDEFGTLLENYD